MSAAVPASNISFSGLRTAYRNGDQDDAGSELDDGSATIGLGMFSNANFTNGTSVPSSGVISINDDMKGKTFGATASSDFTFNFFLIDSYGDGWNGAILTIQDDNSSGAYKTLVASSLSGVAPAANGGITLSSGGGSSSSTAGTLDIPQGAYFITVTAGSWASEITWSVTDGDDNLVDFSGTNTPVPGTHTMNVDSSGGA